jgi:hypothetical protein
LLNKAFLRIPIYFSHINAINKEIFDCCCFAGIFRDSKSAIADQSRDSNSNYAGKCVDFVGFIAIRNECCRMFSIDAL